MHEESGQIFIDLACNFSLNVASPAHLHVTQQAFILRLELLPDIALFDGEKLMDYLLRLQFRNADEFVEEHLQYDLPLGEVLIVIPAVLSLAGNWWNWESRVEEV
jgi:hypothetical protein